MKTYEEMARDVLKRRDEELQKLEALQQTTQFDAPPEAVYPASPKKRRLLPIIAIPCAAAVAIGAVTVGVRYGNSRGEGNTYQPGIAAESSESSTEQLANVTESGDRSGAPGKPQDKDDLDWQLIITLEERPEYLADHAFFDPKPFGVPVEYIPFTPEELNKYYGIDFDRLGRFHDSWEELFSGDHGIYVYGGEDDSEIASSETVNGKKVVSTHSELSYKAHNVADSDGKKTYEIHVEAARIGVGAENVFSPFDEAVYSGVFSPYNFSVIGGYNALFYHSKDENGVDRIEAIIEMGETLVRITSEDDTDFLLFIGEYTLPFDGTMINGYRRINIIDGVPEFFWEHEFNKNNFPNNVPIYYTQLTDDEINSWLSVELDRLGRLNEDWKVVNDNIDDLRGAFLYAGDETDSENVGDWIMGGRRVVWELFKYSYDFKDGGYNDVYDLEISAEHIGVFGDSFDPFSLYSEGSMISYINGKRALIYKHNVDQTTENTDCNCMEALIDYGQTLVHISGWELSDEEFINILDEFTSPEYDIEITPWSEIPQDKFSEPIGNSTP